MTTTELKDILSNPLQLIEGETLSATKCKDLAKVLMSQFWIAKGSRHYWITDLEFYLYADSHRDIITYPRKCEAGCWFFHDSGVDLAFKSTIEFARHPKNKSFKPTLTQDSVFGGILLRGIEPIEPLDLPDGAILKLNGPHKLCNHLFDQFSALAIDESFPLLESSSWERKTADMKVCPREGFPDNAQDKVKSIKYNYSFLYLPDCELENAYTGYKEKKYHYMLHR